MRDLAIDRLRGLVMVLMTVDHAGALFDADHLHTDTVFMYEPGTLLPAAEFLTRWITHLCAPTFLFLAGAGIAFGAARARPGFDSQLALRGLVLMALDPLWMWWAFDPSGSGVQVLFAIGASMVCMTLLRRLPDLVLGLGAVAFLVGYEAVLAPHLRVALASSGFGAAPWWGALLFTGGIVPPWLVIYPLVPWLSMMVLGFVFVRRGWHRDGRRLALAGAAVLVAFVVLRGLNGYGNMLLVRDDHSLVQWLHVSKYPPSLTFVLLELGLALVLLATFRAHERRRSPSLAGPLVVFGQVPLFFYLLHVHLLMLAASATDTRGSLGLAGTYGGALLALFILYPLCRAYRAHKAAHPRSLARLV